MNTRLRYPEVAPEGYAALSSFGHYVNTATTLEPVLLGLVYLRASVLNGCTYCTELHKAELRKHHEPESRIEAVVSNPDSDVFTPRQRAALRWTEVLTRLAGGQASQSEYERISRWFDGKDLVDLCFAVANINAWNRMGIAFEPKWRPRSPQAAGNQEQTSSSQEPTSPVTDRPHADMHQGDGDPPRAQPPAPQQGEEDEGKVGSD